ncbi:MAG TPA: hypothetical protein VHT52_18230, partial [Stellaceae bacterium]|nr:hypothetical protein [Stellaceae bacterium]
ARRFRWSQTGRGASTKRITLRAGYSGFWGEALTVKVGAIERRGRWSPTGRSSARLSPVH